MYRIPITKPSDFHKIRQKIMHTHIDDEAINELQFYFGEKCDMIGIESPYADKDYLSTYYIHYSKKFRDYSKKCYRIHLFSKKKYLGFFTLRPTCKRKIGRSYIHPKALLGKTYSDSTQKSEGIAERSYYIMTVDFKSSVLGNENRIQAFPWMHQEPDVSCCAHVALWSILRYFGTKRSHYSDATMAEIVQKIQYNYDRAIPTRGLRVEQISNLLIQYGFSTLIRSNHVDDEIFTYIESGLPIIGIIPSRNEEAHAVCIIGHGPVKKHKDNDLPRESFTVNIDGEEKTISTDIILSTKFLDSIVVNDDNYLPYRIVYKTLGELEEADDNYDPDYLIDSIGSFIVPFYEKMQLSYNEVYNHVMNLLVSKGLPSLPSPIILRLFITSSNSYKRNAIERGICPELRRILKELNMPKFIWCAEVSGLENYNNGLVDGCIIIDATDSAEEEYEFFILKHDMKSVSYYNGNRYLNRKFEIPAYKLYKNNLKEYNWDE